MSNQWNPQHDEQEETYWLSVSDLMAGLMIVFMFIAVALMREALIERDKIKNVAVAYQENQIKIYNALNEEFQRDLESWDATIDEQTLTFNFNAPEVLFKLSSANMSYKYKALLLDFFPRYLEILDRFKESINEVRIEGHTSSAWNREVNETEAYFKNMALSQRRTRAVLEYVYNLEAVENQTQWMKSHMAAVGLSSSKLVLYKNGQENELLSRRVSFRVITNADIKIKQILELDQ